MVERCVVYNDDFELGTLRPYIYALQAFSQELCRIPVDDDDGKIQVFGPASWF